MRDHRSCAGMSRIWCGVGRRRRPLRNCRSGFDSVRLGLCRSVDGGAIDRMLSRAFACEGILLNGSSKATADLNNVGRLMQAIKYARRGT